ncbi:unnamed protein product, partial [Tetraodon nigroviridis]
GMAPIHLAAWFGSLDILKLLVQAGAEQKVENQSGNRAFALAADNGCVNMLEVLREQYNMDTMKPNQDGETALYLAVNNGHDACALALLEAGCEPNIFMGKSSVLHPVSEKGDTSFLQLLLGHKADTNARNQVRKQFFFSLNRFPTLFFICGLYSQDQEAPLHLAVKNNHIPVIHCLLTAGCDINATDKRSQTALHIAAELAKIDVVEMLLKAEFDLTIEDKQGKTALGVAARADEAIIADMIIKAERYYAWRKANPEVNETVHSQYPLTFKPDHRLETKQFRSVVWRLAYELLKPADWKRLAEHWAFTKEQILAIEEQWTGQHSYKEHGNRMLLIWLHGAELAGMSPAKELYQALVSTGNSKAAGAPTGRSDF